MLYALESSRKDLSFDTAFVSVAPSFTELDKWGGGAKNAPPGCGGWDYPPGPTGLIETDSLSKIPGDSA